MFQWGANWTIKWTYPSPQVPLAPNLAVESPPFQIAVKRLEIGENVKRAHLRTLWLAAK